MKKDPVVTMDTVRELMFAFPGITEGTSYGTPAFRVRSKLLARLHDDGESLVLSCHDRDPLIEADPRAFYVTKHYLNYPWVLVRLANVRRQILRDLIEEVWRRAASARLIKEFESGAYKPPRVVPSPKKQNAAISPESRIEHLARVRHICLALPEAEEKEAWGSPTFRVKKKLFAMFVSNHHGDGRIALWLKAAPGVQAMLVEADPEKFFVPPYVGPGGWIGVHLNKNSDEEVRSHVVQAYRQIASPKLIAQLEQSVTK
ncbi:MAG: MmcQ/YjbR family DNA-binding protein [Acidobacteriota bacterium]